MERRGKQGDSFLMCLQSALRNRGLKSQIVQRLVELNEYFKIYLYTSIKVVRNEKCKLQTTGALKWSTTIHARCAAGWEKKNVPSINNSHNEDNNRIFWGPLPD